MSEWKKFCRSLSAHPGKPIALILTCLGALAGLGNKHSVGHELAYMAFGACVMSLYWVPVLITAWQVRHRYDE